MIDHLTRCVMLTLVLSGGVLWLASPAPAFADEYTIVNRHDSGPGSLRQAILDANAHPNNSVTDNNPSTDTITIAIPSAQCTTLGVVCTVAPTSELPTITDPVLLDGRSQPGYAGRPLIEIDGSQAGPVGAGLTITAGTSRVQGLIVNRFQGSGIALLNLGGNALVGNQVGTDADGSGASGNLLAGISLSHSVYNDIGSQVGITASSEDRNVISGNHVGIAIESGSNLNLIWNNFIGVDRLGTSPLGNATFGISISDSEGSYIGMPGLENSIAFNGSGGILVLSARINSLPINRVYQNGGLGIDLGGDGVTPNDPFDADDGPNQLQNAPTLTSARSIDGGWRDWYRARE